MFLKISLKKDRVYQITSILLFVIIWQLASLYFNSLFFPTPIKTVSNLTSLLMNHDTYYQLSKTLLRVLISVGIALTLGTSLGIASKYIPFTRHFIETVLYPIFHSVPSLCWTLLVVVWFGLSEISPVLVVVAAILPHFIINVWEGIKELNEELIELGKSFTKDKLIIFKKIVFPQLYPYIFPAFRTSFGTAWKVILIGEMFAATNGIGFMLDLARQELAISQILSWTICIIVIIMFFDYIVFDYIDKKTMRKWKNVRT